MDQIGKKSSDYWQVMQFPLFFQNSLSDLHIALLWGIRRALFRAIVSAEVIPERDFDERGVRIELRPWYFSTPRFCFSHIRIR